MGYDGQRMQAVCPLLVLHCFCPVLFSSLFLDEKSLSYAGYLLMIGSQLNALQVSES